ncbi:hypothetical protein EDC05_003147 [Coemansia umbellata]|uniref:Uncharacterized protein n=1 Tax=Coemansia umbellata TaxID=1424467 RepID=A0ABQ8PM48_9FUNG|nr:hypothetical protein EDC05_003147 [Coemansia umbellata]
MLAQNLGLEILPDEFGRTADDEALGDPGPLAATDVGRTPGRTPPGRGAGGRPGTGDLTVAGCAPGSAGRTDGLGRAAGRVAGRVAFGPGAAAVAICGAGRGLAPFCGPCVVRGTEGRAVPAAPVGVLGRTEANGPPALWSDGRPGMLAAAPGALSGRIGRGLAAGTEDGIDDPTILAAGRTGLAVFAGRTKPCEEFPCNCGVFVATGGLIGDF